MRLVFDPHVHIYPCYNLGRFFNATLGNLGRASRRLFPKHDVVFALCLTERRDCFYFDKLASGELTAPGFTITTLNEKNVVLVKSDSGRDFFLFAGRQIVTAERLEILSLLSNVYHKDGKDMPSTIKDIQTNGGVPILNWAPGKWMFKRKKIVAALFNTMSPGELVIGDTSLRPQSLPMTGLMKKFKDRRFQFIYGSDPLPFPEEETRAGTYISYFANGFNEQFPEASLRTLLTQTVTAVSPYGSRSSLVDVVRRLRKNQKVRL